MGACCQGLGREQGEIVAVEKTILEQHHHNHNEDVEDATSKDGKNFENLGLKHELLAL